LFANSREPQPGAMHISLAPYTRPFPSMPPIEPPMGPSAGLGPPMGPSAEGPSMAETGLLPEEGLLAAAYVPIQRTDSPQYSPQDGLKNGTIFQGLNLPYGRYIPTKEVGNTPLGEMMAIAFAIDDLGLYLDTHPHDRDALALRNRLVVRQEELRARRAREGRPVVSDTVMEHGYSWIHDPWPWERDFNQ